MKRKSNKQTVALILSLAVLLCFAVGSTVAYLMDRATDKVTFIPADVSCEIVPVSSDYTYSVKNMGNVEAYVRVAVVVNWKDEDVVCVGSPNYVVSYDPEFWFLGTDGYYYYKLPVAPRDVIESIAVEPVDGNAPADGYELSVEVLVSAIQTTADAIADWSDSVVVSGRYLSEKTEQGGE